MSTIRVYFKKADGTLYYSKAKLKSTRNGNLRIDIGGQLYVFKSLNEDCDIVMLVGGKWVKAGEVRNGEIIINLC